jgi:hypothetical protein
MIVLAMASGSDVPDGRTRRGCALRGGDRQVCARMIRGVAF